MITEHKFPIYLTFIHFLYIISRYINWKQQENVSLAPLSGPSMCFFDTSSGRNGSIEKFSFFSHFEKEEFSKEFSKEFFERKLKKYPLIYSTFPLVTLSIISEIQMIFFLMHIQDTSHFKIIVFCQKSWNFIPSRISPIENAVISIICVFSGTIGGIKSWLYRNIVNYFFFWVPTTTELLTVYIRWNWSSKTMNV